jgi:hypothetical protein
VARSHPIWIHFPLGVIPIAFLAALLSFWKRASGMETTARFCALVAFPTAIAAALSGWLHASEGVDTFEVDLHRWTGVATAVLCGAALVVRNRPRLFVSTLAGASPTAQTSSRGDGFERVAPRKDAGEKHGAAHNFPVDLPRPPTRELLVSPS